MTVFIAWAIASFIFSDDPCERYTRIDVGHILYLVRLILEQVINNH